MSVVRTLTLSVVRRTMDSGIRVAGVRDGSCAPIIPHSVTVCRDSVTVAYPTVSQFFPFFVPRYQSGWRSKGSTP